MHLVRILCVARSRLSFFLLILFCLEAVSFDAQAVLKQKRPDSRKIAQERVEPTGVEINECDKNSPEHVFRMKRTTSCMSLESLEEELQDELENPSAGSAVTGIPADQDVFATFDDDWDSDDSMTTTLGKVFNRFMNEKEGQSAPCLADNVMRISPVSETKQVSTFKPQLNPFISTPEEPQIEEHHRHIFQLRSFDGSMHLCVTPPSFEDTTGQPKQKVLSHSEERMRRKRDRIYGQENAAALSADIARQAKRKENLKALYHLALDYLSARATASQLEK